VIGSLPLQAIAPHSPPLRPAAPSTSTVRVVLRAVGRFLARFLASFNACYCDSTSIFCFLCQVFSHRRCSHSKTTPATTNSCIFVVLGDPPSRFAGRSTVASRRAQTTICVRPLPGNRCQSDVTLATGLARRRRLRLPRQRRRWRHIGTVRRRTKSRVWHQLLCRYISTWHYSAMLTKTFFSFHFFADQPHVYTHSGQDSMRVKLYLNQNGELVRHNFAERLIMTVWVYPGVYHVIFRWIQTLWGYPTSFRPFSIMAAMPIDRPYLVDLVRFIM